MARIRTVKPEFWTDEKVVKVSAFARLLFIGLWNFADDDGRMVYSPERIKMQIFPADNLSISKLFDEIRGKLLVTIYTIDNVEYLQINNFSKHQKIDKRSTSRLPPPTNSLRIPPNSSELHLIPTTEGKGREGKGSTTSASSEKISLSADGVWLNITEIQKRVWINAYPALNLNSELSKAAAWIISNPKNKKSDYAKFLNGWFSRTQDKAPKVSVDKFEGVA